MSFRNVISKSELLRQKRELEATKDVDKILSTKKDVILQIGEGKTRADHKELSDQLYNSYSKAMDVRSLAEIVGEEGIPESSKKYLQFADAFEKKFMKQDPYENRDIDTTLNIAWDILSILPESEWTNISEKSKKVYINVVQKRNI